MKNGIIQVGIVGFGLSASAFHAPFLRSNPRFQIVAVFERSGNKAEEYFSKLSQQEDKEKRETINHHPVQTIRSMEDLLKIQDLDLVVITTPPETHYPLASLALKHKKHVLLEKPAAITSSQVLHLIKEAEQNALQLCVFQNRRYDSDYLTVKSLIEKGKLGRIVEYEANFDKFRLEVREGIWKEDPNQLGTGILYDLGSHLIDQALDLFGLPDTVSAQLYMQRDGTKIVDAFHLTFGYKKTGLSVLLRSSCFMKQARPHFVLYGTMGSFVKYGLDVQESQLRAGWAPTAHGFGVEPKEQEGRIVVFDGEFKMDGHLETLKGNYSKFFDELADALHDHKKHVPVTAVSAFNTIRLIELAMQSHEEQRVVLFN